MNNAVTQDFAPAGELKIPPLEPPHAAFLADEMRYCPAQLLSAFALLMAGHGRAVCTSMMLGDREYAMSQLARAHTLCDAQLRVVTARLFDYFDEGRAHVPVGLRA